MNTTKKLTIIGLCIAVFLTIFRKTDLFGLITLDQSITSTWINEISFWIFLGLIYVVTLKIEKTDFLLWKETKRKWYFYIISVISIFAGAVIVGILVPIIFKLLQIPITQNVLETTANHYCENKLLLLFGCLTAGVVEEFIYRGYLMPRIEVFSKHKWVVIALSAIIFGAAHVSNLSIIGIVVPTFIGLIFSYHYYMYRSLTSVIIAHFLIDFASFITTC